MNYLHPNSKQPAPFSPQRARRSLRVVRISVVVLMFIASFWSLVSYPISANAQAPTCNVSTNRNNPACRNNPNSPAFQYFVNQGTLTGPSSFVPIVSVPGINVGAGSATIGQYVNAIFQLAIGIGAILAVLMLIIGGFEYMTQDAVASQSKGRERMQGAVLGAVLLLLSYLIIWIIDPRIIGSIDTLEQKLSGLSGSAPSVTYTPGNAVIASRNTVYWPPDPILGFTQQQRDTFASTCSQSGGRGPFTVCVDDNMVVQNNPSCFDPSGARRFTNVLTCYH